MTLLLLAATSQALQDRVEKVLEDEGLPLESRIVTDGNLLQELDGRPIEAVLIGPEIDVDAALDLAEQLDESRPDVSVVLVAGRSARVLERALRAGVRDVIPPEASPQELGAALQHALETTRRRRASAGAAQEHTRSSRVITVVSPKGGAGKTVIASNLGVGLAAEARGQVVLVDLDLQFGDIANALLLVPEQTIADAIRSLRTLDTTTLKVHLISHASGLYVLAAPNSPAEGEQITAEQVQRILELLTAEFRYVVVDTGSGLSEHTLAALDVSTDVLLVSDMDVASVRSVRKAVDALDRVGLTGARRSFILNRADSRVGLERDDIAATVGMEPDVEIPSSRLVPLSFNQGTPLLEAEPRSPVARSLRQVVGRFVEVSGPSSGGLFFWRSG